MVEVGCNKCFGEIAVLAACSPSRKCYWNSCSLLSLSFASRSGSFLFVILFLYFFCSITPSSVEPFFISSIVLFSFPFLPSLFSSHFKFPQFSSFLALFLWLLTFSSAISPFHPVHSLIVAPPFFCPVQFFSPWTVFIFQPFTFHIVILPFSFIPPFISSFELSPFIFIAFAYPFLPQGPLLFLIPCLPSFLLSVSAFIVLFLTPFHLIVFTALHPLWPEATEAT